MFRLRVHPTPYSLLAITARSVWYSEHQQDLSVYHTDKVIHVSGAQRDVMLLVPKVYRTTCSLAIACRTTLAYYNLYITSFMDNPLLEILIVNSWS